jgi:hypothetical protein
MQQVIRDEVPKRLQRKAREFLRGRDESVVEAIAHALVRTADQASGGNVTNRAMASTDGTK